MRDVVVTAVVFGLLPVALFHPFVGVSLWTWLSVMNPHRLTWGFAYSMPFAQLTAIATLLSLVIASQKVRLPVNGLTTTLMVFIAWTCVTYFFSFHPDLGFEMWTRVLKTLFMTLVAVAVVRTELQVKVFVWILTLSVAFYGIKGGFFAIMTAGEMRVWGPPDTHIHDNNSISVALVMMIPLLVYAIHQTRRRLVRIAIVGAILLCAASIVGSYSRGAFVAGTAMLGFLALKSRQRGLYLILMVAGVLAIAMAMPDKWWERMATIVSENPDGSVQGRFNAWSMAWNLALDRPIVGGGFAIYEPDVFARYAPDPLAIHAAHSVYFQMLGEHGFVGLFLFLLLALFGWRTATRVIRAGRLLPEAAWRVDLARALQVSMIGFFVGGLTVNIGYWDVYYFLLVALVALERLALAEVRGKEDVAPAQRCNDPAVSA